MCLCAYLLALKAPLFLLPALMLAWGLGWTFNHAGVSTLLTDLPEKFLNEAASLNSSLRFVSGGLGVVLSGWLMQQRFSLGFMVLGTCLLGLLVCTQYCRREVQWQKI
jgi:predicted MFS family arabinose efflux permease